MRMGSALIEYEALREATRPRLAPHTVEKLRTHAEFQAMGDKEDRAIGQAISVLLDMHDRLEAIRHGQA